MHNDLTPEELRFVPLFINGINQRTKDNPITAKEICTKVNLDLNKYVLKRKLTDVTIRSLVAYVRENQLCPIAANGRGYFKAQTKAEMIEQIESLKGRRQAIAKVENGMLAMIDKIFNPQPNTLFQV